MHQDLEYSLFGSNSAATSHHSVAAVEDPESVLPLEWYFPWAAGEA